MIRHGVKFLRKAVGHVAREVMGTVTHVKTNDRVAALTFDDGPHPESTPRLLDILERYRAYGTFFVLGEAASKHPEILERMAKGEHAIGNHSWDHPSFPLISSRERRRQILACANLIAPYGKERLFRPPYGEQSFASRLDTLWLSHKVIMFNCEVGDWYETDAHGMADALCKQVEPGSIIALHDALRWHATADLVPKLTAQPLVDRRPMLRAMEMFLERMRGRYHFVTVPTLLRCGRPQRQNWYRTTPPETVTAVHSA